MLASRAAAVIIMILSAGSAAAGHTRTENYRMTAGSIMIGIESLDGPARSGPLALCAAMCAVRRRTSVGDTKSAR